MERSLLWSALALGCVGYACGLLLSRPRRNGQSAFEAVTAVIARPYLVMAAGLAVLVYLATLPGRPPFAAGHGLGNGFALGAVGALLAGLIAARAMRGDTEHPLFASTIVVAPQFASVVAASVALLAWRDNIVDALMGTAIGWFTATMILYLGLTDRNARAGSLRFQQAENEADLDTQDTPVDRPDAAFPDTPCTLALLSGLGFAVTLCATCLLGAYRGAAAYEGQKWSAAAVALAAGIPFLLLACALPASFFARFGLKTPVARLVTAITARLFQAEEARQAAVRAWRLVLSAGLLLGLTWLLSRRVLTEPHLIHLLGVGLLAGLLAWWLMGPEVHRGALIHQGQNTALTWPLAVLLVLSAVMVAYNLLAGYGIGVLLLGAWLIAGMAQVTAVERIVEAGPRPQTGGPFQGPANLLLLLFFGAILLLYRVVTQRFEDDLKGVGLSDYYAIAGFLFGALLPHLLAALQAPPAGAPLKPGRQLARLVIAGAITLVAPALILILWKSKTALALLAGLALSTVQAGSPPLFLGEGTGVGAGHRRRHPNVLPALFALGIALAVSQWTHHVLQVASLSRHQKITVLEWIVGVLIALILAVDYGERFGGRLRTRRGPRIPTPPGRTANAGDGGLGQ